MSGTPRVPLQPSVRRDRPRRSHRTRRWIKRGALGLVGLGVAAGVVYAWLPSPVTVDAAAVRRGPLAVTVQEDGRTRVRDRFVVLAPVGGELDRIELDAGAAVARGQTVAWIRPPRAAILDARMRDEARARVTAAVAHLRQAETGARRARAAHVVAARDAQRARVLHEKGAISAAQRERTELAAELADGERAAAELQRTAAAAEVRGARAVLSTGAAAANGAAVPVLAPASGKVLRVLRDSAGPVAVGAPLLELGDPASLEVVVDVLSTDAARIAPGAPVAIDAWGGDRLTGRVRVIEPSATTRVSALGVEEQRVDVVVALDRVPAELGDGFRVETSIELWRGEDVVTVPAGALFRDRGRWAVYAVVAGRAQLTHVEVGHRGTTDVEVSGLVLGARVVLHAGDRVADGTRIEIRR